MTKSERKIDLNCVFCRNYVLNLPAHNTMYGYKGNVDVKVHIPGFGVVTLNYCPECGRKYQKITIT